MVHVAIRIILTCDTSFKISCQYSNNWASQCSVVKNLPANAGDAGDMGMIPGLGRSGVENNNPLQFSCLENPKDRGA